MVGKYRMMLQSFLCLALLIASAQAGFSAAGVGTGPGCINCVNTNGVWGCKLTQTNGGTDCTPIGSGCVISGSCIMPTVDPQPDNPSTGTLKYRIEMSDEILREIGTLNPRAAAALDQLRPMGPLQMPVKIYQSSTRRGAPAIVHEIKIGRDPVDGELILTVRQIGGEERNAFAKLKITVSPQWETDGQWRLAPKLWQIDQ